MLVLAELALNVTVPLLLSVSVRLITFTPTTVPVFWRLLSAKISTENTSASALPLLSLASTTTCAEFVAVQPAHWIIDPDMDTPVGADSSDQLETPVPDRTI